MPFLSQVSSGSDCNFIQKFGLQTISNTKLSNFQADYKTKDSLKISTFTSGNGNVLVSISCGSSLSAFYELESLSKIKSIIQDAKQKINSIREDVASE